MLVAVFTLLYGIASGEGPSRFFRDSDTGWHIRTGERILAGDSLPRQDPYSFSKSGEPWLAWEWAADLAMGMAHRSGGLKGVALLYASAAGVAAWLWFRLHWAVGGNFFLACAMAAPMLTTVQLHWLARPHVFGWLLCLLAMLVFEAQPQTEQPASWSRLRWQGLGMAALGMVWANVHASFFFLPATALLYAAGRLLNGWLWAGPVSSWKSYVWMAVWAAAGTLLNPYGIELHRHVVGYLLNGELLSRIGEYQSFNFHADGAGQILLTVGIGVAGAAGAVYRRRAEHFLFCSALIAMSLRSARGLPLVALLALPLANGAFTNVLEWAELRPRLRVWLDVFLAYSRRVRLLDRQCGGWLVAPLAVCLGFVLLHAPAIAARAGFPAGQFPVAAAAAIEKLPQSARLLAPDMYGGYLIYRFEGRRPVFFDGRSDFYGVGFMKEYIRLIEARPGWREQIQKFRFTHALLPNNYSLLAGLEYWGWKRLYRDEVATLLAKD